MPSSSSSAVFVHSTGTSPALWNDVPDSVCLRGSKVCPVNLGYPPGALLSRGTAFHIDEDVRHVHAQIPGNGVVDLYAHSYGGAIALRLGEALGDRLRSMLLIEPVIGGALLCDPLPGLSADAIEQARAITEHPWFLKDDPRCGSDEWLEFFIDFWNKPGAWQRMPETMKNYGRLVGWKMYQEVRSAFVDVRAFASMGAPRVVATVLYGSVTPIMAKEMTRGTFLRTPQAELVELPGLGHMALVTRPADVFAAMQAHAMRVSASGH